MIYFSLDKNSKKPMYLQISDQIREMILTNQLRYNQKLFSEKEFTFIYNVSEIVVKKAYGILRDECLISSYKGLGTFVTNRKIEVLSFNDLFYFSGFNNKEYFKTIILTEEVETNETITKNFNLSNDENIHKINLVILKEELPFIYRTIYIKNNYKDLVYEYLNEKSNALVFFKEIANFNLKTSIIYNTQIANPIMASILLIKEKDPIASYKITLSNNNEVFMYVETSIPGNYLIIRKVG